MENDMDTDTTRMPECGFSLNWQMKDATNASVQITMRSASIDGWPEVMRQRHAFVTMAMEHGWTTGGATIAPPLREQASVQPQTETATALTFMAESLTAQVQDGKTFWRIKGGRFSKFGVAVYPEVLDKCGFAGLNPLQEGGYNMAGWTAEYIEKDGKPNKVVRLYK
jgi:hypothetical protein